MQRRRCRRRSRPRSRSPTPPASAAARQREHVEERPGLGRRVRRDGVVVADHRPGGDASRAPADRRRRPPSGTRRRFPSSRRCRRASARDRALHGSSRRNSRRAPARRWPIAGPPQNGRLVAPQSPITQRCCGVGVAGHRDGAEPVREVAAGEHRLRRSDGVVVDRLRREPRSCTMCSVTSAAELVV